MSAVLSCPDCRAAWQRIRAAPVIRDRPPAERRGLIEAYFAAYHRLDHDANQVIDEVRAAHHEQALRRGLVFDVHPRAKNGES